LWSLRQAQQELLATEELGKKEALAVSSEVEDKFRQLGLKLVQWLMLAHEVQK
jgi:hypothetical protein